jgi:hypothetical protein
MQAMQARCQPVSPRGTRSPPPAAVGMLERRFNQLSLRKAGDAGTRSCHSRVTLRHRQPQTGMAGARTKGTV